MRDCKNCFNYIFCQPSDDLIDERVCPFSETAISYFAGDWSVWQNKRTFDIRIYQDVNRVCTLRSKNRLIGQNEAYQLIDLAERMDLIGSDD